MAYTISPSGRRRSVPQSAWATLILLGLHRHGIGERCEIGDADGHTLRKVVGKLGVRTSITPQSLSGAAHTLKGNGVIAADSDQGRTYSIWLLGQLSPDTVKALVNDRDWAVAAVNGEDVRRPAAPPVIEFVCPDESMAD